MDAEQISTTRSYSREEYLNLVQQSLHKIEYLDGAIRWMAGGTQAHGDTVENIFVAMCTARPDCYVKSSERAISVASLNRYYFPDASATCAPPEHELGAGIARLTNPTLIVEVLSKGTAEDDRGEKFAAYRQLPSFREYLLIDSRRCSVETWYREEDNRWRIGNYYRLEQRVKLFTLEVEIPLSTIYAGVQFEGDTHAGA